MPVLSAAQGLKLDCTLFVDRFDDDGKSTGLVEYPNLTSLALEPQSETAEIESTKYDNAGSVLDSYTIGKPTKLKFTANQMDDKYALSAVFLGSNSDLNVSAATAVSENVKLFSDAYGTLSNQLLTSITSAAPLEIAAGAGSSGVVFNQYSGSPTVTFTDPSANSATLSVSVSGDDINVSLATDGIGDITTVSGDIVTLINSDANASELVLAAPAGDGLGVVTALVQTAMTAGTPVSSTDIISDNEAGFVGLTEDSLEQSGVFYTVIYAHEALSGYEIEVATKTQFKGRIIAKSVNKVSGKNMYIDLKQVNLSPSGDVSLVGDDPFASGSWEGSLEVPTGQTSPATIRRY